MDTFQHVIVAQGLGNGWMLDFLLRYQKDFKIWPRLQFRIPVWYSRIFFQYWQNPQKIKFCNHCSTICKTKRQKTLQNPRYLKKVQICCQPVFLRVFKTSQKVLYTFLKRWIFHKFWKISKNFNQLNLGFEWMSTFFTFFTMFYLFFESTRMLLGWIELPNLETKFTVFLPMLISVSADTPIR